MPADPVRVALIQMACAPSIEQNLDHGEWTSSAGRPPRRATGVPARAVPRAVFLPVRGPPLLRAGRVDPWADDRRLGSVAKKQDHADREPVRAARCRPVPQYRGGDRRERRADAGVYRKMHIPDDPLYYEKFYFTPGDPGFRAITTKHGSIGSADLLGPVVPRGRAPHRAAGRRSRSSIPTAIGWHPGEKAEYGAAQYTTPGRPSSAPTRSRTAASCARPTASATSTATSSSTRQ